VFIFAADTVGGKFDFIVPDIVGFFIFLIDCDGQQIRVEPQPFFICQVFPGPVDGFAFKVIPKREISQHFKKCVMIGGDSHILNVAGAQAHLAGCGACEFKFPNSQKLILKLIHSCGSE